MSKLMCLIPARGGSKRIPRKNIKSFLGVPILQRVIETAYAADLFDRIYVSSEDREILDLARQWGAVPLYCSTEYAHRDDSMLEDVLDQAIEQCPAYPEICMLLATAVLIKPGDLQTSYELFAIMHGFPVISYIAHGRDAGQFYFVDVHHYKEIRMMGAELLDALHIAVPFDKSLVQDINTEEDWKLAEEKYRRLHA